MSKPPASYLPHASTDERSTSRPQDYEIEAAQQLEKLLKELKVPDGAKILELAAGTGFPSAYLASKGYKTTVTDFSENMVKKAKEYYEKAGLQGEFQVLDMFNISNVTVGMYDVVFVIEILDHYDGWEVVQVLQKMKDIAQYVIVLSQNPKCMPYLLYQKAAKERGDWRSGLLIFRESLADLAKLAGLEVIKETYFTATTLSKWMAKMVSPETGELYADSVNYNLIPENQRHFRVLAARARIGETKPDEEIDLCKNAYESEIKALHRAYDFDIQSLIKRTSDLEDELVTRINSIRQLELTQDKENRLINTPIGLLLSLYYERADLQKAFPEVIDHDYKRLLKWAQEMVSGKLQDYSAKKLLRFAEWYNNIAKPLEGIVDNEKSDPSSVLLALYLMRKDLQKAFPEVIDHDYKRLLKWAQNTVNGKTGDYSAKKLLRFAEWYNKAADDSKQVQISFPSDNTISAYFELLRDLKLMQHRT